MIVKTSAAFVILLSLAGCTTESSVKAPSEAPPPERGVTKGYLCDASSIQSLVGEKVSSELGEQALVKSGAKTLRWIPPRTAVTRDFRTDRLNIRYNDFNRILRINCG